MSDQDLRKIIQQEYVKCAQDPAHFMRKYCYIQHPQRGRVVFNLYRSKVKYLIYGKIIHILLYLNPAS
jgi:hypothetical protein